MERISQGLNPTVTNQFVTWNKGQGGHAFVLDTGINRCHPVFATPSWTSYAACIASDPTLDSPTIPMSRVEVFFSPYKGYTENKYFNSSYDFYSGHGSHVASLLGGSGTGAAPEASLYALVWDSDYDMMAAMSKVVEWAQLHPALPGVLNLSFTEPTRPNVGYCQMVKQLVRQGIVPVTAAANAGSNAADFEPARCQWNIVVGNSAPFIDQPRAVDRPAMSSNWGERIDVWAPGSALGACANPEVLAPPVPAEVEPRPGQPVRTATQCSTQTGYEGNYRFFWDNGTSMAAPLTAGVATVYVAHTPHIDPPALRRLVTETGATRSAVASHASVGTTNLLRSTFLSKKILDVQAAAFDLTSRYSRVSFEVKLASAPAANVTVTI